MRMYTDFFEQPPIRYIETLDQSANYLIVLLKMALMSVKHDGKLRISDTKPYTPKELSQVLKIEISLLEKILTEFKELDLIKIDKNKSIYITMVESSIGSETPAADRKRKQRKREKEIPSTEDVLINENPSIKALIAKSNYLRDRTAENKKEVSEYVWLTNEELNNLHHEFDEADVVAKIEEMSDWIEKKGTYYENHYSALRKWIINDEME